MSRLTNKQKIALITAVKDDPAAAALLAYDWRRLNARDNQIAPEGDWFSWLVLAGRGFGKTRTGAEWVREKASLWPGCRIALVAPTAADARDTMVEGESGILAVCPPWDAPKYEPSKRRLTWPNGTIATMFSAEEPERLRGPQHHFAWCDELCAWFRQRDTWDQLMFGLRLEMTLQQATDQSGLVRLLRSSPQTCITTTPKPTELIKEILRDPSTISTRGSTYDNQANLAASFFKKVVEVYQGTRLGRQEINAEILDDNPAALWKPADIEKNRRPAQDKVDLLRKCKRVAVGVDPAVSSNEDSDETGIIVAGIADGPDGQEHGFVFDDASLQGTPKEWAQEVVNTFKCHQGNIIYAEVNNGGDLVVSNIHTIDPRVKVEAVRASRGKFIRAEPVASLYEQGRIHHVGVFKQLEDQMTGWNPLDSSAKSPDRMDALVWVIAGLFNIKAIEPRLRAL